MRHHLAERRRRNKHSSNVGQRVIGEGECLAFWPARIGTCCCDRVRNRVPYLEVPEDAFHDVDIIDVLMMRGVAPQLHSMSEEKRERSVLTLLADAANKVGF